MKRITSALVLTLMASPVVAVASSPSAEAAPAKKTYTLSVKAFQDSKANWKLDKGEKALTKRKVAVKTTKGKVLRYIVTNAKGVATTKLPRGTYLLTPVTAKGKETTATVKVTVTKNVTKYTFVRPVKKATPPQKTGGASKNTFTITTSDGVKFVNALRRSKGLAPLTQDASLNALAQQAAREASTKGIAKSFVQAKNKQIFAEVNATRVCGVKSRFLRVDGVSIDANALLKDSLRSSAFQTKWGSNLSVATHGNYAVAIYTECI